MRSSNKVIKANRAASGKNAATISTDYELPKKMVQSEEKPSKKQGSLDNPKGLSKKELSQIIEKEKEKIKDKTIGEAQAEIESIKEKAYEESYNKGHQEGRKQGIKKGYEEGHEQGYDEGYQKAMKETELKTKEIHNKAIEMLQEAHEKMQKYETERKEAILKLASHMAEKIVHDYIDQSSEGILTIAEPYFYQIDKEEEFVTITVHPDKRKEIEENLDQIEAIAPETRFMVLGNPSLEKRGMLIESTQSIVDLQIKKQLDSMLDEFYEMERTVDA